ncbi:hypothetical protein ACWIG4_30265 [Streptomyces sp. NPDC002248]
MNDDAINTAPCTICGIDTPIASRALDIDPLCADCALRMMNDDRD